jgi:cytoplasmic iron level regulating protein YaaA (DUF328/UPF0246 family)
MGVRLKTPRGKTLYQFWGDRIALALNKAAEGHKDRSLVNLDRAKGTILTSRDIILKEF